MTMSRRQIVRAPRKSRQWALTMANGTLVSIGDSIVVNLLAGLRTEVGQQFTNLTASAIRLRLYCSFDATSGVGDRVEFAWGIIWATDNAIAAGVASLPDPRSDNADWMAHGSVQVISESALRGAPRHSLVVIDNDSMRKQRENNSSLIFIAVANAHDDALNVRVNGRVLFLLP